MPILDPVKKSIAQQLRNISNTSRLWLRVAEAESEALRKCRKRAKRMIEAVFGAEEAVTEKKS